jgi:hypothetical protein
MFLEDVALVAGTLQNLSNLYSLDIYERNTEKVNNYWNTEITIHLETSVAIFTHFFVT